MVQFVTHNGSQTFVPISIIHLIVLTILQGGHSSSNMYKTPLMSGARHCAGHSALTKQTGLAIMELTDKRPLFFFTSHLMPFHDAFFIIVVLNMTFLMMFLRYSDQNLHIAFLEQMGCDVRVHICICHGI